MLKLLYRETEPFFHDRKETFLRLRCQSCDTRAGSHGAPSRLLLAGATDVKGCFRERRWIYKYRLLHDFAYYFMAGDMLIFYVLGMLRTCI